MSPMTLPSAFNGTQARAPFPKLVKLRRLLGVGCSRTLDAATGSPVFQTDSMAAKLSLKRSSSCSKGGKPEATSASSCPVGCTRRTKPRRAPVSCSADSISRRNKSCSPRLESRSRRASRKLCKRLARSARSRSTFSSEMRSKRPTSPPKEIQSSCWSGISVTRDPLTAVPFLLRRSTRIQSFPVHWKSACRAETLGSSRSRSLDGSRPTKWCFPSRKTKWRDAPLLGKSVNFAGICPVILQADRLKREGGRGRVGEGVTGRCSLGGPRPLSHSPTLPLRGFRLHESDSEDFEKRVCGSKLAARLRGIHCRQQIFHI